MWHIFLVFIFAVRRSNSSYNEKYIEDRRLERIAEFAPPAEPAYNRQLDNRHREKDTYSDTSTLYHTRKQKPSGKDLDEFLKLMRNLS